MSKFAKYKTRISKSQSDKEKEELQYAVEDAQDQLQSDLKATKRAFTEAKRKLDLLYGAFPLDSQAILEAEDDVEGLEKGVERLTALEAKLF